MNKKPIIGMTLGDPAGIGPEITAKLLSKPSVYEKCRPIVIGDSRVVRDGIRIANKSLAVNPIGDFSDTKYEPGTIDVYDLQNISLSEFTYGQIGKASGKASGEFIEKAIRLALEGKIEAIVTNPIHKKSFTLGGFGQKYAGHTEMLANLTGTEKYSMMLACGNLRALHVTTHIPLEQVASHLSEQRIYDVIELAHNTCKQIGITHPKIGVAGLNPHSSDGGKFGNQEETKIIPAIKRAVENGIRAEGPVPGDTLFSKAKGGEYDAEVVMYHDQGHIPMKFAGFVLDPISKKWIVRGVNVTLGLPIIRTSVDHGTAFGKAGKGEADPSSLEDALDYAILMAAHKKNVP
ncbi:MAG: 4-hydroxythreonine-4-phosphate dehydrogenase PdxA [archaeon]